jgi:hypothetical protein
MYFNIILPSTFRFRKRFLSGLRSLRVTFPPHNSSDAGSNPAEVAEFLSPPGGTLSWLARVVNLLHVKEPQAPKGPLSKIICHFPSKVSVEALRWADHSFKESCRLWHPPEVWHIPPGTPCIEHKANACNVDLRLLALQTWRRSCRVITAFAI